MEQKYDARESLQQLLLRLKLKYSTPSQSATNQYANVFIFDDGVF